MNIKVGNKRLELCPPTATGATARLGKVGQAVLSDEAINYAQLQNNSIDKTDAYVLT